MGDFMGAFRNSWVFDSIFMVTKFGSANLCINIFVTDSIDGILYDCDNDHVMSYT